MQSRSERFRGKLMAGDQVIFEPVEGQLKSSARPGSGNGDWTGYFEFAPERRESLANGNRYRLVLIDGRSANIYIHIPEDDPLGRTLANFHGQGTFRR
ncbi:MAG TPA: hypothetical protein VG406_07690 [Isosphaeraceae bacterium]|jgi:hypothetical protein|nr:hypothetical protein [Isosphaeraceae bacterium]